MLYYFSVQRFFKVFGLFGLLIFLHGCVSSHGLPINREKNPDALRLTRLQAPPAVKTYIFTQEGEGYWVDVNMIKDN